MTQNHLPATLLARCTEVRWRGLFFWFLRFGFFIEFVRFWIKIHSMGL